MLYFLDDGYFDCSDPLIELD